MKTCQSHTEIRRILFVVYKLITTELWWTVPWLLISKAWHLLSSQTGPKTGKKKEGHSWRLGARHPGRYRTTDHNVCRRRGMVRGSRKKKLWSKAQQKMLWILICSTLFCRQCQGKSEILSNLGNFHQSVDDPLETKQNNQQNSVNSDESPRQRESLLEVVEVL